VAICCEISNKSSGFHQNEGNLCDSRVTGNAPNTTSVCGDIFLVKCSVYIQKSIFVNLCRWTNIWTQKTNPAVLTKSNPLSKNRFVCFGKSTNNLLARVFKPWYILISLMNMATQLIQLDFKTRESILHFAASVIVGDIKVCVNSLVESTELMLTFMIRQLSCFKFLKSRL
jgi:hypothetical protein